MANCLLYTKRFPKTIILNYIYRTMEEEIQSVLHNITYLNRTIVSKPLLQVKLSSLDTLKFCQKKSLCSKGNWIFLVLTFFPFRYISAKYLHFEDLNVRFFAVKKTKN